MFLCRFALYALLASATAAFESPGAAHSLLRRETAEPVAVAETSPFHSYVESPVQSTVAEKNVSASHGNDLGQEAPKGQVPRANAASEVVAQAPPHGGAQGMETAPRATEERQSPSGAEILVDLTEVDGSNAQARCTWSPVTTGSIKGHNLKSAKYAGYTIETCKAKCDKNPKCKSIDFSAAIKGNCLLGDCFIGEKASCVNDNDKEYIYSTCTEKQPATAKAEATGSADAEANDLKSGAIARYQSKWVLVGTALVASIKLSGAIGAGH